MGLIDERSEVAAVPCTDMAERVRNRRAKPFIKNRVLIVITLFLFIGTEQWAQSPNPGPGHGPWQYGTEILNLEQRLANPAISAYERYDSLVRLARLKQLSGNISGAAANWLDAAAVNPNDDNALVSGAYCLTAIGEWERAYLTIQPLLASPRKSPAALQAFYLDAYLKTWSSSNASPLAALAGDPGFVSLRPMLYYTLWQVLTRNPNISGAGSADFWKARLISEYPGSPEALIAAGGAANGAIVSAVQSPLWLLFPGAPVPGSTPIRPTTTPPSVMPPPTAQIVQIPQTVPAPNPPVTRVIIQQPSQTAPPVAQQQPPVTPPPVAQPVAPPVAPPMAPPPQQVLPPVNTPPTGGVIQTGSFSREANAHNQAEALRRAGFTATVSSKIINGTVWWTVRVPAGQNADKTMQDLKKAGIDKPLLIK